MLDNLENIMKAISEDMKRQNILVIGDIMLDRYYFGDVQRISPEAPVPVVRVNSEKKILGGAANVANNLSQLGCNVLLAGVAGDDDNGQHLFSLLENQNIKYSGIFYDNRPTTTKTRVIGLHQQMMRLDFEETGLIGHKTEKSIINYFEEIVNKDYVTVILSDYGKGVCSENLCQYIINKCNEMNLNVIIDPKGNDWNKYRGAKIITPNVKELGDALGRSVSNEDNMVQEYGELIRSKYGIETLLITRSEKGMSLLNSDKIIHIPTVAKEVFDVSGAGDTVVATLAAAIASGLNIKNAVKLANIAASVVVSKVGTYPIKNTELLQAINDFNKSNIAHDKIITIDTGIDIIKTLKSNNKKIVFTNGCFDILHIGHVKYLEDAKKLGDTLVIGLNSDASVKRLKGESRPINNEMDRAKMLAALGFVDYIIIFTEDTPSNLIQALRPNILVKGGDYKADEVVGREFVDKVEIISFVDGYSTTKIINNIISK